MVTGVGAGDGVTLESEMGFKVGMGVCLEAGESPGAPAKTLQEKKI